MRRILTLFTAPKRNRNDFSISPRAVSTRGLCGCRRCRTGHLLSRRQRAFMENHPVDTEPILHLPKAEGKESLFYRHQDPIEETFFAFRFGQVQDRKAKKVSSIGIKTRPPSESAAKTR